MNAAGSILGTAALVGAVLGVLLDLYSLALWLRRNKTEQGRSGVSGASWILYFAYAMSQKSLATLAVLTLFHASCHWLIPALHRRWIGGESEPG